MRFGSVCSGIEAASVAWHPLGWQAAWLSEIEPFPCAVLKHHYPDVPNHGDMTTLPDLIRSGQVEAPDLFCGGTPCQAFSVAGLRQSLNDARGNLSLTFCEIADAIDSVRSARGEPASIVFWENVPGVLSTKDNAFGCFLGALAGSDTAIVPSGGKWTDAGVVAGPKRTVAWRTLDAQYFGVAQRRRRVFVVASAREGFDPAAVLFEWEGLRRDTAPSREAGQTVAPTIAGCANGGGANGPGRDVDSVESLQPYPIANTLTARMHKGINSTLDEGQTPVVQPVGDACLTTWDSQQKRVYSTHADYAPTLSGSDSGGGRYPPAYLCVPVGFDSYNHAVTGDISKTLDVGQDYHHVPNVFSIHPHCIGRAPESGPQGKEYLTDGSAYCMDSRGQPQAVAFHPTQDPISSSQVCHSIGANENATAAVLAPTLTASNDPSRSPQSSEITAQVAAVVQATAAVYSFIQASDQPKSTNSVLEGMANTLTSRVGNTGFLGVPAPINQNATAAAAFSATGDDVARTITAGIGKNCGISSGARDEPIQNGIIQAMQVRRLTPVECERLQGFPDNYTAIPWRGKGVDNCPDGPRYKALGNSWAVPVVRWIGKRIQESIDA